MHFSLIHLLQILNIKVEEQSNHFVSLRVLHTVVVGYRAKQLANRLVAQLIVHRDEVPVEDLHQQRLVLEMADRLQSVNYRVTLSGATKII